MGVLDRVTLDRRPPGRLLPAGRGHAPALLRHRRLRLLALFDALLGAGSQVLLATHSPLPAAFPGATIYEFDAAGFHTTTWDELEMVQHWRAFLDRPDGYLRYLFDG